ncbi:MAG: TIGR02530 family flagellar biosynthesis protein [Thermacetogeniaceae bacterium]
MTDRIYFPQPILPVKQAGYSEKKKDAGEGASFEEILAQQSLKFSRHAQERIAQRGIALDAGQLRRIQDAVDRAAAKGARESLILLDNLAFVVSIKNRTVITAVDEANLRGNVFTNIDSAVII